jgi:long-subunit fatty acid transport protein
MGPGPVLAQAVNEQDQLDFGRVSLAVGSGARALGMGGAFLARPDDATAASWNPAGLSYLRFTEVSLVGVTYTLDTNVRGADGTLLRVEHTRGTLPDFLSLALPLSVGTTSGAVQLSYQRVVPYTGDRTIDQLGDPPRTLTARGGFDVLALSTGFKLASWLRAGVSVNRWMNGFTQHQERLLRRRSLQDADFALRGWSLNGGVIAHPHEAVNLGLVAKTKMSGSVDLSRSRTDIFSATPNPDVITHNAFRSDDVRLDLPAAVGFGASWRASSVFTVSGDYTVTFWSRARIRNYFTLSATPDSITTPPAATVFPTLPFPNVVAATQSDTRELRVGVEYVLIAGRLKLPLRAGYVREKQYRVLPDGTAPRLDGVTGGAGLILGPVLLDAAYVYQWIGFGPPSAREKVRLHRALLSLIYRHGSGS